MSELSTVRDGALEVLLHPLIILSIADHYTRAKIRSQNSVSRVYGVLLGVQRGKIVEVCHSFEVPVSDECMDATYLHERINAEKQVYSKYEVVGWYSTYSPEETEEGNMQIQRSIEAYNQSPLFLSLNPIVAGSCQEMPVSVYQTEIKLLNNCHVPRFTKIAYKIETDGIERIAIDYAVDCSSSFSSESLLKHHLLGIQKSIELLRIRILTVSNYLKATIDNFALYNHAALRHISSLVSMLPAFQDTDLQVDLLKESNLTLLLTYLSATIKTIKTLNNFIDKFNVINNDSPTISPPPPPLHKRF